MRQTPLINATINIYDFINDIFGTLMAFELWIWNIFINPCLEMSEDVKL